MKSRGRDYISSISLLVIIGAMLSPRAALATQAPPPPAKAGTYPTQVTATVTSLKLVKSSTGVGADLGEDIIGDKTLFLIKLRIHTRKPLTAQGTPLKDDESVEVISRETVDKAFIGKKVRALLEMRGDSTHQRWLLTEIHSASSSGTLKKE